MMRYLRSRSRPTHSKCPVVAGYKTEWLEPAPDWVVQSDSNHSGRMTGLYHLKRQSPAFSTLCGLEKPGWHRWPPGLIRPPEGMCCRKCMGIATRMILEGRIEIR